MENTEDLCPAFLMGIAGFLMICAASVFSGASVVMTGVGDEWR
jgi:hypothetical protein